MTDFPVALPTMRHASAATPSPTDLPTDLTLDRTRSPGRRAVLATLCGALSAPVWAARKADKAEGAAKAVDCGNPWPSWGVFKQQFLREDGRVMDSESPRSQTVSEAQAYGMFFALVGNDRAAFDKMLKWTEDNLAGGDLTARLPAWLWGKRDDNTWGVVDPASASDADIWLAYTLAEAARLWNQPRYQALSTIVAERILREEVLAIPGLGLTLMPGPRGFQPSASRWRLNPSYVPLQVMRALAQQQKNVAWGQLLQTSAKMIYGASPKGYCADWVVFDSSNGKGFEIDNQAPDKGEGGHDAVRVYLWAGLMAADDPARAPLLKHLAPMAAFVDKNRYLPESVNVYTGDGPKPGPVGFSAAVLPFLEVRGDKGALQSQLDRLLAKPVRATAYYEQSLALFAYGWRDKAYRFGADGRLTPAWKKRCA